MRNLLDIWQYGQVIYLRQENNFRVSKLSSLLMIHNRWWNYHFTLVEYMCYASSAFFMILFYPLTIACFLVISKEIASITLAFKWSWFVDADLVASSIGSRTLVNVCKYKIWMNHLVKIFELLGKCTTKGRKNT